jgi:hypothetical protein
MRASTLKPASPDWTDLERHKENEAMKPAWFPRASFTMRKINTKRSFHEAQAGSPSGKHKTRLSWGKFFITAAAITLSSAVQPASAQISGIGPGGYTVVLFK